MSDKRLAGDVLDEKQRLEFLQKVSALHDGELLPEEAEEIRQRIADSTEAASFLGVAEAVGAHIEGLPRPDAPIDLADRVRERLIQPAARLLSIRPLLKVACAAAAILFVVSTSLILSGVGKKPDVSFNLTAERGLDLLMDEVAKGALERSNR